MNVAEYCCKAFAEEAGKSQAPAGGGLPQFEQNENGWNISGCCGGGCYVVTGMRFCPFCGRGLI